MGQRTSALVITLEMNVNSSALHCGIRYCASLLTNVAGHLKEIFNNNFHASQKELAVLAQIHPEFMISDRSLVTAPPLYCQVIVRLNIM